MAGTVVRARNLQRRLEQLVDVTWPSSPLPGTARSAYLRAAASADWPGVAGTAKDQRREARTALTQITRLPRKVARTAADVATEAADLLDGWVRLDHRDDWDTVRGELVAALKPQTGLTKAEALVDALGTTTARTVRARLVRPVDDLAAFLAESAEQWRAVLVGADLAEAVADLNRRRPRGLPQGPPEEVIAPWRAELTERLDGLRDALAAGDPLAIGDQGRALAAWARGGALDDAVRWAVDLAAAREDAAVRWSLGPAAQATGDLVRDLLLAAATGLTVEAAALVGGDALEDWYATRGLPLAAEPEPGHRLSIAQLSSAPATHDGEDVVVEGVVGTVTIRHVHHKVLSTALLHDEAGHVLTVGLEHIKIDSGGLVEGAYATLAGTFVATDPVFQGPTLRLGRHSYVEEAARSFHAAALRLTRAVITPVPHGLRYSASWERGLSGAANQLRFGTWLPFERGQ